ncbi:autoinducer-binding transcriptional regulator LuxR [Sulfitobacter sp. NAS-14.1]|nr:autoinducer-binding transcriptional regulator LuxR [Sulfitobacter sp. NAS-14.1]
MSMQNAIGSDTLVIVESLHLVRSIEIRYRSMSLSEDFSSRAKSTPELDLETTLNDLSTLYGLKNITYFSASIPYANDDEHILITTYSTTWVEHYFSLKYQDVDPVLHAGSRSLLPVDWGHLSTTGETSRNFFGEAKEYGIGETGLTIPVRGMLGEEAMISLNSDLRARDWELFCREMISDFTYFAHLLHDSVTRSRIHQHETDHPQLTKREAQVLRWAARGKTAWETGIILGLTEKTVSFYLGNACAKLKVATKTQAVAFAVKERLILI